jgi:hypothetical protein
MTAKFTHRTLPACGLVSELMTLNILSRSSRLFSGNDPKIVSLSLAQPLSRQPNYSLLPEVVELLLRHGMNPREEAPV